MPFTFKNSALPIISLLLASIGQLRAQEVDEVSLTFSFPVIGQVYVSSAFRGEQPMLALGEMLGLLFIPYSKTESSYGFSGSYPTKTDYWEIDPTKFKLVANGKKQELTANQFYLSETDLYLTPDVFAEVFGLNFIVNPYALTLNMDSKHTLPIEELKKRQMIRKRLKENAPENLLKTYPMMYPRKRALLALGMVDYNFGINSAKEYTQLNVGLNAGIEILGGDLQTSFSSFGSQNNQNSTFSNTRWRYVFKGGMDAIGNPLISEMSIGQVNLTGPIALRVRGMSLSNNPIIPRRVLDVFAIEGYTTPDSEIELLIGGQLVDFTRADELGYYRFSTPLTYGTIRIGLRIYTPQGEVLFEDRQLQIPFNFVPRGLVTYNVQAGVVDNFQSGITEVEVGSDLNNVVYNADVSYGLTNNITIKVGGFKEMNTLDLNPKTYGSVSFRVLDQYLFNVEAQPELFYRGTGSVMYSNNTSLNVTYTQYNGQSLLNFDGEQRSTSVNYFLPVTVFKKQSGLRFGLDRAWFADGERMNYQVDVNTRIGPIITRLNYREELNDRSDFDINNKRNQLATAILTYTVPRKPGVPVFVRGMFFRTSFRHDMKQFDATAIGSLQFSQTVWKRGRLTLAYDRDILRSRNTFQAGLIFDFNAIRTTTQTTSIFQNGAVSSGINQTFSGSIGADFKNGVVIPTNRDQVGRAGVTARMFVDENSNGKYDKGEEIISARALRLDLSANLLIGSDGFLRITQLQSYWTYRLTVDRNALDPNLAPLKDKFSFVADPNQYKTIDIPLYRTGTIEGFVYRDRGAGVLDPQPGVRLILHREGDEEPMAPIKSFSDGGFYAYGLIPGNYTMLVDTTQLAFMNVIQVPDTLRFTIRPLPEGDYIDTLEIKLVPAPPDSTKPEAPMTLAQLEYLLGERLKQTVTSFTEAQEHFYRANYSNALAMVDSSLTGFPTDFGLALKGSITYLLGDKRTARDLWSEARYRNPFIEVPDTNQVGFKPLQNSDLLANRDVPVIPPPAFDTIEYSFSLDLMENFEAELGGALNAAVSAFVEAQELFYRRRYVEADAMIDTSLSIFVTDHALALKGSILYITGRQEEAWRIWAEARERNPLIALPETQILDRLIKPVARTSTNGQKKYSLN